MSKLLPVGTYVLVKDPGIRDSRTGEQLAEPREYYGVIRDYDMGHTKYQVGVRFPGWGRWLFGKGGDWPFPSWCTEVTEQEANHSGMPQGATMSIEQQRADVYCALRASLIPVDNFLMDERRNLEYLSNAARTRLIVEAALAYLVGNKIITVATGEEWPDLLPMEVPSELRPDAAGEARRAQGIAGRLP